MKRKILLVTIVLLCGILYVRAQDPVLIIDENFQEWTATEGVVSDPPADCEATPNNDGPDMYDLAYETGGSGMVKLIKYFISPACNSKRVNQAEVSVDLQFDVTTGFVSVAKTQEETDTIGEMWLPKLSNITQIEFGFSCTSSDRGVRLYSSTDDGVTWEGPWTADGPDTGGEIIGTDTKLGINVLLDINRDNVILKFTSGVDNDGVSQYTRIHNIKVWGVPGSHETGIEGVELEKITAYYSPEAGLVVKGEVMSIAILDMSGRTIMESYQAGDQTHNLSNFSNGTYILKMTDLNEQLITKKFLKY